MYLLFTKLIILMNRLLCGYKYNLEAPIQVKNNNCHTKLKNVEPIYRPFHYVRPSHCPVNRNEQR